MTLWLPARPSRLAGGMGPAGIREGTLISISAPALRHHEPADAELAIARVLGEGATCRSAEAAAQRSFEWRGAELATRWPRHSYPERPSLRSKPSYPRVAMAPAAAPIPEQMHVL